MTTILTRNHTTLFSEVAQHLAADALVQGQYWMPAYNAVGGKGCFFSCLTHSDDPAPAYERFGLPETVLRIAENIFEALPDDEARNFFAALPGAVECDGKDLSRVHWQFLGEELRALPPQTGDVARAVDSVTRGMDLLADGKDWPAAALAALAAEDALAAADSDDARAAAYAAAYAAEDACYAPYSASYAARAADAALAALAADAAALAAARRRQRDTFLRLIAEAPIVGENS